MFLSLQIMQGKTTWFICKIMYAAFFLKYLKIKVKLGMNVSTNDIHELRM